MGENNNKKDGNTCHVLLHYTDRGFCWKQASNRYSARKLLK